MKMKAVSILSITFFSLMFLSSAVYAGFQLDAETGAVFTGYNDVRIPGDTGTKLSLSDDLDGDPVWHYRARLGYTAMDKHYFGILAAPLTVTYSGRLDKDVTFQEKTFTSGTDVDATFMFNSYRFTYRYLSMNTETLKVGIGLTAKVRHASIKVESDTQSAEKKDLGFVPLLSFMVHWKFAQPVGLLVDGDALASQQGRAEDILFALTWDITDAIQAKAGYRILEGGADNDEVYTFSMFHYAVAGVTFTF